METLLGNNSLSAPDKLNIVPIYSDIDEVTSYINNNAPTNNSSPNSILNNSTDDDETDQSIILNYLGQKLGNHPSIIVTDKIFLPTIECLIIQQNIKAK